MTGNRASSSALTSAPRPGGIDRASRGDCACPRAFSADRNLVRY